MWCEEEAFLNFYLSDVRLTHDADIQGSHRINVFLWESENTDEQTQDEQMQQNVTNISASASLLFLFISFPCQ